MIYLYQHIEQFKTAFLRRWVSSVHELPAVFIGSAFLVLSVLGTHLCPYVSIIRETELGEGIAFKRFSATSSLYNLEKVDRLGKCKTHKAGIKKSKGQACT